MRQFFELVFSLGTIEVGLGLGVLLLGAGCIMCMSKKHTKEAMIIAPEKDVTEDDTLGIGAQSLADARNICNNAAVLRSVYPAARKASAPLTRSAADALAFKHQRDDATRH